MPRIIIITQGITPVIKPLINNFSVIGIIEASKRRDEDRKNTVLFRLAKSIYYFIFRKRNALRNFANRRNIPYFFMEQGCTDELASWVEDLKPDIIAVYSMSQLLKENIFRLPHFGTINLHPSLLPSYRGPNPYFWMYYDTDLSPGVTVHYIDKGEDTGNIICQEQFNIPLGIRSNLFQEISINQIGVNLLIRAIKGIASGEAVGKQQTKESPTVRARMIADHEHKNIINWDSWPVERIWHLLRGTEDWLNATEQPTGLLKGHRWEILDYIKRNMDPQYIAGNIYVKDKMKFLACKDGLILLRCKFNLKIFLKMLLS